MKHDGGSSGRGYAKSHRRADGWGGLQRPHWSPSARALPRPSSFRLGGSLLMLKGLFGPPLNKRPRWLWASPSVLGAESRREPSELSFLEATGWKAWETPGGWADLLFDYCRFGTRWKKATRFRVLGFWSTNGAAADMAKQELDADRRALPQASMQLSWPGLFTRTSTHAASWMLPAA